MTLVKPCIYYSKKNTCLLIRLAKWKLYRINQILKKEKNSQVFYQTICMQVIKFLVSYVNNKILKQIIEKGDFVEIIYPTSFVGNTYMIFK